MQLYNPNQIPTLMPLKEMGGLPFCNSERKDEGLRVGVEIPCNHFGLGFRNGRDWQSNTHPSCTDGQTAINVWPPHGFGKVSTKFKPYLRIYLCEAIGNGINTSRNLPSSCHDGFWRVPF